MKKFIFLLLLFPIASNAATYQCDNFVITEKPWEETGCINIETQQPYKAENPTKTNTAVTKFDTVEQMITQFNDYSALNGTFKLINDNPLHIQLSPVMHPEDSPSLVKYYAKRTFIYGIYRTFVHTPFKEVTVTVIPQEFDAKTQARRYLNKYKATMAITKIKALSLIQNYLQIDSLDKLITSAKVQGMTFNNQWIKEFGRFYYNDQGIPGLDLFFYELSR